MKRLKAMYISIFVVLILMLVVLFNSNEVCAATGDYTQDYENGYSASFSNYVSTDNQQLGTVDVRLVFRKKIADNATIPDGWTKVDDNTLSATKSQSEYNFFTLDMNDGTQNSVYVVTPFKIKKGVRIPNISLGTFGLTSEGKTLSIVSSDSNVLKVTENTGTFAIEAVGVGSATLTGNLTSSSDEILGGTLTVKGFVEENLDSMDCWNVSLSKNKVNVKVGESSEIAVNATLKDEYSNSQVSGQTFSIACEIADTTIARQVAQSSENATGTARIEGLKVGNTTMKVTVTSKSGDTLVFRNVPISVSSDSTQEDSEKIPEWEITLNKEKLDMKVGDKDDIIVNAQLKEGYSTVQVVEKRFNVSWKIEDTTIAKYTAEEGEEMTGKGKAGSAKIEAVKSGTTKLIITVSLKQDSSKTVSFEVPITVSASDNNSTTPTADDKAKGNGNGTNVSVDNNSKQSGKTNGSEANRQMPSAGSNNVVTVFIITGVISMAIAIIRMKKLKK